jgi:pimeloyl-ACP methyl ester carboxylesterase
VTAPATPHLRVHTSRGDVRAIALVLHGGMSRSTRSVPPWSLAYLRMRPFVTALRRAGGDDGLAVASLRYLVRGWNGDLRSPVPDTQWALEQLRRRFGDVPVALIGHSMGGRAALAAADGPTVSTVVGLAPWIEAGDPVTPVTGRNLLILHGTRDRTTSPRASAQFAQAARSIARQVTYVTVEGDGHPMLRRPRVWHQLAAGYTTQMMMDRSPEGSIEPAIANVLLAATSGASTVTI